jgi:hypothetical protein
MQHKCRSFNDLLDVPRSALRASPEGSRSMLRSRSWGSLAALAASCLDLESEDAGLPFCSEPGSPMSPGTPSEDAGGRTSPSILRQRFVRRLAAELQESLQRAVAASGDLRAAELETLFDNLVSPMHAGTQQAIGLSHRPGMRYFSLLSEFFLTAAGDADAGRLQPLCGELIGQELFAPIFTLLLGAWLHAWCTASLVGGALCSGAAVSRTGGRRSADDSAGVSGDGGGGGVDARELFERLLDVDAGEQAAAAAAAVATAAPMVDSGACAAHRAGIKRWGGWADGRAAVVTRVMLVVRGMNHLFWLDTHDGTELFRSIFTNLCLGMSVKQSLCCSTSPYPFHLQHCLQSTAFRFYLYYMHEPATTLGGFLCEVGDVGSGAPVAGVADRGASSASAATAAAASAAATAEAAAEAAAAAAAAAAAPTAGFSAGAPPNAMPSNATGTGTRGGAKVLPPALVERFVEGALHQLRALRSEGALVRSLHGFSSAAPLLRLMGRKARNNLSRELYAFQHPGGPLYPTRKVRHAAYEAMDRIFPRGARVRRCINFVFRLLHPFSFSSSDVFHLIKWRATKLSVVGSVVAVPSIVMNSLRSLPLVGRLVTMVFGKVQSEGAAPAAAHGHLHSA